MLVLSLAAVLLPLSHSFTKAQPSPDQQKRIAAAIKAAANQSNPDYTAFVNPFIGTGWSLTLLREFKTERCIWQTTLEMSGMSITSGTIQTLNIM